MFMKKDLFLGEVARIYFIANNYLELFPYLRSGFCSDVIHAQLNAIRSMDKNCIWQQVDAFSIFENLEAVNIYVEMREAELASKFISLDVEEKDGMNLRLWFSCMYMLVDFAADKKDFLQKAVAFFEKHVGCFYGEQYWALLTLLIAQNMDETIIELSSRFNIKYDLPANIVIQIFDAKFHPKPQQKRRTF